MTDSNALSEFKKRLDEMTLNTEFKCRFEAGEAKGMLSGKKETLLKLLARKYVKQNDVEVVIHEFRSEFEDDDEEMKIIDSITEEEIKSYPISKRHRAN